MGMTANIVIVIVGLLHVYFLVLEMFFWTTPQGLKTFRNTPETAEITKVLAANQGLYNGFLAAGLFWSVLLGADGFGVKVFFLSCVVIAGGYGAISVSKRILYIQSAPAALGLALVCFA